MNRPLAAFFSSLKVSPCAVAILLAAWLVGCTAGGDGAADAGPVAGDADVPAADARPVASPDASCPTSCAAAGAECGTLVTGCGVYDCGGCLADGMVCGSELDGTANRCVPDVCEPFTCADLGCGISGDGCGGTLDCGTCECTPLGCDDYGADACGALSDSCGATIDCGACPDCSHSCGATSGVWCGDATLACDPSSTLSCGACGLGSSCASNRCECDDADGYENNNTRSAATDLGNFADSNFVCLWRYANLGDAHDVDWYKLHVRDAFTADNPSIAVQVGVPADTHPDYEVSIFFVCDHGGDAHHCTQASPCTWVGAHAWLMGTQCATTDDSGVAYIRVRQAGTANVCVAYSLSLRISDGGSYACTRLEGEGDTYCDDGTKIRLRDLCDTVVQCPDGSDEVDCFDT